MKKHLKYLFCLSAFLLCSINFIASNDGNNAVLKWQIKVNGKTYEFTSPNSNCSYCDGSGDFASFFVNDDLSQGFSLNLSDNRKEKVRAEFAYLVPMNGNNTFVFGDFLSDGYFSFTPNRNDELAQINTTKNSTVTLNITSFPSAPSDFENPSNPVETFVIGNFEGKVEDFNGVVYEISGSFKAVRCE